MRFAVVDLLPARPPGPRPPPHSPFTAPPSLVARALLPARPPGRLKAPPSLVARSSLLSPGSTAPRRLAHALLSPGDAAPLRLAHRAGSRAVTANLPPPVGPTVRLPPHDATRSAIPARPNPPDSGGPGLRAATPFAPGPCPFATAPAAMAGPLGGQGPESVTLTVTYPGS